MADDLFLDGGPAFPLERVTAFGILQHRVIPEGEQAYIQALERLSAGMSLRDFFAAKALVIVTAIADHENVGAQEYAAVAYEVADAMLAEKNRRGKPSSAPVQPVVYAVCCKAANGGAHCITWCGDPICQQAKQE